METTQSKLALSFYALAAGQLVWLAWGIVMLKSGGGDTGFRYMQFQFPQLFFLLVNPAFCLLAGLMAQALKNARLLIENLMHSREDHSERSF
jgi:hypothetical protein